MPVSPTRSSYFHLLFALALFAFQIESSLAQDGGGGVDFVLHHQRSYSDDADAMGYGSKFAYMERELEALRRRYGSPAGSGPPRVRVKSESQRATRRAVEDVHAAGYNLGVRTATYMRCDSNPSRYHPPSLKKIC